MRVSVIVPTLNEAASVVAAIERAWLAGADEVVVADGGSGDATCPLARQARCRLLQTASGRGTQQHAAAQAASGDVLLFLHADTWLPAGAIDQIRRALVDGHAAGGAFRQRIEAEGRGYRLLEGGNALRARLLRLPYGDQGLFLRREVYQRLGGFPQVPLMEDVLLMRRFARRWRPLLLPGPLYVSARRWQWHGPLRQTLRNWALLAACLAGVPPARLAGYYRPHEDGARPAEPSTEQPSAEEG